MFNYLKFAASIFGRGAIALTAGQMVAIGVVAVVIAGGIAYYYTSRSGRPSYVLNYPQPVYLVHTDRYWDPDAKQWSNVLPILGGDQWFIMNQPPDAQSNVQILFMGRLRYTAHADRFFAFRSNQELCPKMRELKTSMTKDLMRKYGCE